MLLIKEKREKWNFEQNKEKTWSVTPGLEFPSWRSGGGSWHWRIRSRWESRGILKGIKFGGPLKRNIKTQENGSNKNRKQKLGASLNVHPIDFLRDSLELHFSCCWVVHQLSSNNQALLKVKGALFQFFKLDDFLWPFLVLWTHHESISRVVEMPHYSVA